MKRHEKMAWRELVETLWDIIDDIDTMDDVCRGDDVAYRKAVRRLQKKRWETGITTDGYTLAIPGHIEEVLGDDGVTF